MSKTYDLIVIGAGSGGLSIGLTMSRIGLSVLIVNKTDYTIGGECLNFGCVPSKALIHVSQILQQARQARDFGFSVTDTVNFEAVKQYITRQQDIIREHENAAYLRDKEKVDVELGTARFTGKNEIEVNGKHFRAKRIVIATGSSPRSLDVPGADLVTFQTNETIFRLSKLPEKLLVIGAGPIGIELSQAFGRLGCEVTVVGSGECILEKELPEISAILQQRLEEEKIIFKLNAKVTAFMDAHTARIEYTNGQSELVGFDTVLLGIGRTFHWDDLNLPAAGIETEKGKLKVDAYLRTTNPNVYVVGDAAGSLYFSHAAELHASVLTTNFLSPLKTKLSYDHFSWVTFTDPEVATFGLTPDELEKRGIRYEKITMDLAGDDRATVSDYRYGKLVLFIKPARINPLGAKLLGGTIIAPTAGEMIQELILARQKKLSVGDLFNKIYPYPTASRVNKLIMVEKFSENIPRWLTKVVRWLY